MLLKKGYRAPDFRIATVGGNSRALHDYRGTPALVYGWGSWDASREHLGTLEKFHEKHGAEVRVISIAFDAQGPGFAMRYLKPAGASHELLIDATCVLARAWGVKRVPFLALLDAEGYVQFVAEVPDEATLSEVRATLKKRPQRRGELKIRRAKGHPRVDILVQGCGIFLSRARTADAANSLRQALELDPQNEIIRGQIAALEHPDKIYR